MRKELTHSQLQAVYSQASDIIETMDAAAIAELFQGNEDDVDFVLENY
jgi:hypothetical protein